MDVPFLDLKAQYATIRSEIQDAVSVVLETQQFVNGPEIEALEEALAAYCEREHAVAVSSGSDALLATLLCLDIGPGDEVVTTPYSFFATAGSVWRSGARPVFVDIDPDTFNLDVERLEAAIGPRTRALMPVHLFGQMVPMDPLLAVAERHGLPVIEDAAQAIGATWRGRRAGSLGRVGCFSFFPSKNLGGLGMGGLVVTDDAELAERLRRCRAHGAGPDGRHDFVGGNFRLDALQAAALRVKLRHLEGWHAARRANAARYGELFAEAPEIVTPRVAEGCESIFNQYVIRVPDAPACREHLRRQGIGFAVYYPRALHQEPCFAGLGYRPGDLPEAERAAASNIALPIYPELPKAHLERVATTLEDLVRD